MVDTNISSSSSAAGEEDNNGWPSPSSPRSSAASRVSSLSPLWLSSFKLLLLAVIIGLLVGSQQSSSPSSSSSGGNVAKARGARKAGRGAVTSIPVPELIIDEPSIDIAARSISSSSNPSPSSTSSSTSTCHDEQPNDGNIHRRCRLTPDEFIRDYYRLGRPVIVKDALPLHSYSFATPERLVQHHLSMPAGVAMEAGSSVLMWNEMDEARGLSTIDDIFSAHWHELNFNFSGSYFFLRDGGRLSRLYPVMRQAPYFIGDRLAATHHYNPTIYFGGPAAGAPAHVDLGACMVSYQHQIRGSKMWKLTSPLKDSDLLHQESFATLAASHLQQMTVEVHAGETFVWFPGWKHETWVPSAESLSVTNHFDFVAGGGLTVTSPPLSPLDDITTAIAAATAAAISTSSPSTSAPASIGSIWPYLDAYRILVDRDNELADQRSCMREWYRDTLSRGSCSSQPPPLSRQV